MNGNINIENLKIAVEGIRKLNLTDDQFTMLDFCGLDGLKEDQLHTNVCGTIACFAGWMPFVKGLEVDFEDDSCGNVFSYLFYIQRILGLVYRTDCSNDLWRFLFSGLWVARDNTLDGALARAQLVIDGNYPGDRNWNYNDYEEGWHNK